MWPLIGLYISTNLAGTVPLPGVTDLLRRAEESGLSCAVASSSRRESVEPYLHQYGIHEKFRAIVTREDAEHPKPAPDLYRNALRILAVRPDEAVALEDSLPGAKAALAAGMRCIGVPSLLTRHLEFPGGVTSLNSLAELDVDHLCKKGFPHEQ
ncbi:HAD-IA family hydrolase [Streptomyces sp. NBC_00287]|uniref:HAD family hydrolase n=1 Tax=Streptomyces sp. NBC_00287 TaxID=2975702 RepID=UPI002E2A2E90|nr:HAD-IA family hydrolase [Streptomyces sp. NBC_00287]